MAWILLIRSTTVSGILLPLLKFYFLCGRITPGGGANFVDKTQYRMLRCIKHSGKFRYTAEPDSKKKIIYYLANQQFICFGSDCTDGKPEYCQITEKGKDALYQQRKDRRRWLIPVAISVFASIGGYREELALIAQAIKQLWKSIVGG